MDMIVDLALSVGSSGMPWPTIVVAVIGTLGGATGIVTLITVGPTRRKMAADTDSTYLGAGMQVSEAALRQMNAAIEQARRDREWAARLLAKVDVLEVKIDDLEDHQRRAQRAAEAHRDWDTLAQREINSRGGNLPPPPELIV